MTTVLFGLLMLVYLPCFVIHWLGRKIRVGKLIVLCVAMGSIPSRAA